MQSKKAYLINTLIKSIVIPLLITALTAGAFYLALPRIRQAMPTAEPTAQTVEAEGDAYE